MPITYVQVDVYVYVYTSTFFYCLCIYLYIYVYIPNEATTGCLYMIGVGVCRGAGMHLQWPWKNNE